MKGVLAAAKSQHREKAVTQSAEAFCLRGTRRPTWRKSSGKNRINLPVRSILQRTRRLLAPTTVPCGGGSLQGLQ
jgi:hypothetical protein